MQHSRDGTSVDVNTSSVMIPHAGAASGRAPVMRASTPAVLQAFICGSHHLISQAGWNRCKLITYHIHSFWSRQHLRTSAKIGDFLAGPSTAGWAAVRAYAAPPVTGQSLAAIVAAGRRRQACLPGNQGLCLPPASFPARACARQGQGSLGPALSSGETRPGRAE